MSKLNNKLAKNVKTELVQIGRRIAEYALVVGPGGNTSARAGDVVYMKASGACFESALEKHYIGVEMNTCKVVDGAMRPTCEISMHLGCYEVRPDVMAVVHTHPDYSTAWAMSIKPLRAFTPDFAALLGPEVPALPFIEPGGKKLADAVKKVIAQGYNSVFLCNHGLLTVGSNLTEAFYRTLLVESAAKTALLAEANGTMKYFTKAQINAIYNMSAEKYRRELLKKY
ncbi:MAG: class II aldolase/adducin family protein [Elusimicrobiota bacterium]